MSSVQHVKYLMPRWFSLIAVKQYTCVHAILISMPLTQVPHYWMLLFIRNHKYVFKNCKVCSVVWQITCMFYCCLNSDWNMKRATFGSQVLFCIFISLVSIQYCVYCFSCCVVLTWWCHHSSIVKHYELTSWNQRYFI